LHPTDTKNPDYFHKVVDCQWACPAHTPVPEYIRLIAAGRYSDAYVVNWKSNVFPGILGRTCDRPCEPACRRVRVEKDPVAICRLKRVAADNRGDISDRLPTIPGKRNGKRVALKIDAYTIAEAQVTEGLSNGALVQITAGLSAGDIVVTDARRDLATGAAVNPIFAK